ncbi:hypothetical protein ACTFIU_006215 [Dictyostelium citrinum]
MKNQFGFFVFLFYILIEKINSQAVCNFEELGNDYNFDLEIPGKIIYPFQLADVTYSMNNCFFSANCGSFARTMICGKYNSTVFQLGNYDTRNITYTKDGVMVTYVSSQTPANYPCSRITTVLRYNCDTTVAIKDMKLSTSVLSSCKNQIDMSSIDYCQKCLKCVASHGSCNQINGWCTCDQYTRGTNCNELKASISSVVAPTIDGGNVVISGNFLNIFSISPSITITIGSLVCSQVSFSANTTQISCNIGADQGYKNITLSDGNGASLLYQGFYYHYPCSKECSPYGTCNDVIGCVCNFNYAVGSDCKTLNLQLTSVKPTLLDGGQAYLIGNFSNVIGRTLSVKIGTQQCTNINFNQTTLECTIGSGEGIKDIVITSDSLSFTEVGAFEYQYYTCRLGCLHGICNKYNGLCNCNNGTYGDQCQYIECPLNCSTPNGICDKNTGICDCDNKYSGESCDFILCPLNCSTPNGVCDGKTGQCDCDDKHSGESCQLLECQLDCSAPNGTCNKTTGTCTCDDKHSGDYCDFIKCPLDCSTPNGICDGKTGTCKCNNQYIGDGCDAVVQCKQECSAKHGVCDTHTLDCICDTQTKGLSCEESRLLIEAVEPTSKEGGTTTIAGYFGVTTSLLSIKIGDSQCTNIQRESDSKLKCDIGPGEGTHNISITDDDLSYTGVGMFQYVGQINKISKISGGAIAGIAVGCVVGVSVIGAGGYYQYRRNKKIKLFMYDYRLNDPTAGNNWPLESIDQEFVYLNLDDIRVQTPSTPKPVPLTLGAWIGITVGCCAFGFLVCGLIIYIIMKKSNKNGYNKVIQ